MIQRRLGIWNTRFRHSFLILLKADFLKKATMPSWNHHGD